MLQLSDYRKYYGSRLIIETNAYQFKEGLHWVKGENGSGKTTLFKTLAGILPFDGEICLSECELKKTPDQYRLLVNFAEADPVFPPTVKGSDLMRLFEKYKQANNGQAEEICGSLGINFLDAPFSSYSSGMGKKLSILLALLGKPKVVLLDEPLVTLDVKSVEAMLHLISLYRTRYKTTFLISSHQAFEKGIIQPDYIHLVANGTICGQN